MPTPSHPSPPRSPAGARLLLALLEHFVTRAGGAYAFCDTDSMAIVATQTGGLVPCPGGPASTDDGQDAVKALSWEQVDAIRARFESLKPYDTTVVTADLLELEDENFSSEAGGGERQQLWCYAISAKRYVLYTRPNTDGLPALKGWTAVDGGVDVADDEAGADLLKPSQHGLGHLLNPTDPDNESRYWIPEAWELLLRADPLLPDDGPEWLDLPAVARATVSSPYLRDLFGSFNNGSPYAEQIKPFNFMATCFVPRPERPADDQRMVLIAPYNKDPTQWLTAPWTNRYSGRTYHLTTQPSRGYVRPGLVRPRTYRDILAGYLANEEAKSLAPDGRPCHADTQGLLRRRPVRIQTITDIGKESNRLEDRQSGLIEGTDEYLNHYDNTYTTIFEPLVVPILRRLGVRETSRRTGHSLGAVSDALAGRSRPRAAQLQRYVDAAETHARTELARTGQDVPEGGPVAAMRNYLETLSDG